MRLGVVKIHEYVVDLDNEEMVDDAKDALWEDISNAIKFNEYPNFTVEEREGLSESEIPDFLKEMNEQYDMEDL
jgi:hypothetical protein